MLKVVDTLGPAARRLTGVIVTIYEDDKSSLVRIIDLTFDAAVISLVVQDFPSTPYCILKFVTAP